MPRSWVPRVRNNLCSSPSVHRREDCGAGHDFLGAHYFSSWDRIGLGSGERGPYIMSPLRGLRTGNGLCTEDSNYIDVGKKYEMKEGGVDRRTPS